MPRPVSPKFIYNERVIYTLASGRQGRAGRVVGIRDDAYEKTEASEWHYIVEFVDGFSDTYIGESYLRSATEAPADIPVSSVQVGSSHEALAHALRAIEANDMNYDIRTVLVYEALALASQLGYPAGIRYDPTQETPSAWPVVCIDLPAVGEVAWHMAAYDKPYTGYTTEDKYQRVAAYCKAVGK